MIFSPIEMHAGHVNYVSAYNIISYLSQFDNFKKVIPNNLVSKIKDSENSKDKPYTIQLMTSVFSSDNRTHNLMFPNKKQIINFEENKNLE